MLEFLQQLNVAMESQLPFVYCTIVATRGSTPQKAGASMLVYPDGRQVGTIGGGCVEAEVKLRALQALQAGAKSEVMTIFLAGYETTANALTWTWYLLSQNPDAEARLHIELDSVLQDRSPTFDDLPHLRYTEMVVAESMRLFPPAWAIRAPPTPTALWRGKGNHCTSNSTPSRSACR